MLSIKHFFLLIVGLNLFVIILFFSLGIKDPAQTPSSILPHLRLQ